MNQMLANYVNVSLKKKTEKLLLEEEQILRKLLLLNDHIKSTTTSKGADAITVPWRLFRGMELVWGWPVVYNEDNKAGLIFYVEGEENGDQEDDLTGISG